MAKKKLKISKKFGFIPFFVLFWIFLAIFLVIFLPNAENSDRQVSSDLAKNLIPWQKTTIFETGDDYIPQLKWNPAKTKKEEGKISFLLNNKWQILYPKSNWKKLKPMNRKNWKGKKTNQGK